MSQHAVAFDFDERGRVIGAHLTDGWSAQWQIAEFGFQVLRAYLEQQSASRAQVDRAAVEVPQAARTELFAEALDIIREANALIERTLAQAPAAPETATVSDPRGHVVVTITNGAVGWVDVNESWLRQAEPAQVEADLVAAFTAAEDTRSPASEGLAALAARHQALLRHRNDYRRP